MLEIHKDAIVVETMKVIEMKLTLGKKLTLILSRMNG